LINNLSEDYQPPSKRERIQEADPLLELGFKLMKQALSEPGRSRRRRASMFRDGFAIALMAMRPLRLKNFISIEIGRHLVKIGGAWRLVFLGTETKNHMPIDVAFPLELVAALEAYLHTHRPRLPDGKYDGATLWVSYWWKPMSPISMRHEVCKWTEQAFGFPTTPHRFRDSAATTLAIHEPEQVQIAHHILGNGYLTMEGTYNQAKGADAGRHFNASMSVQRSEPGAGRRPRRRRA
jgi:integrase/recombinase XerD